MNPLLNHHSEHISEDPPHAVKWPLMFQTWRDLTFLHWRYTPDTIRQLLPRNLELDTFDGAAWIGLTPFLLTGLRAPGLPALPRISQFPEMNVRTYVRGPDGERGIWFFSLEADRLAAVLGARISYRLPYRWAQMQVRRGPHEIEYTSHRHFGQGHARIRVQTESLTSATYRPDEQARFLTARFRLYTVLGGHLAFAQIAHPRWPLQPGRLVRIDQNVIEHSGVPAPLGEPLVHFSPGVDVRIGRPRLA